MAWPVYSVTFVRASAPATVYTYTVPSGKVAIVTNVAAVALAAAGSGFNLRVGGLLVLNWSTTVQYSEHLVSTRMVARAGETVQVTVGDGATHVTAGGYLISGGTTIYSPLDDVVVREAKRVELLPVA